MSEQPWLKLYPKGTRTDFSQLDYNNLAEVLVKSAAKYRDKIAFTTSLPNGAAGDVTYDELDRLTDNLAVYFREELGLKKGDVVAVQSPNCNAYPIAIFGIQKAGLIATNVNPLYTEPEMVHQFNDSGAKALVVIDMFADRVDKAVPQTKIKNVIRLSVADFFPFFKGLLIKTVLKYVKKQVPDMKTPNISINDAISTGARIKAAKGINVSQYYKEIGLNDVAVLQYTGGTTGVSKGAVLSHRNLITNFSQVLAFTGHHIADGKEVTLVVLPLYHIFAFSACMTAFLARGGRNILIPNPRPLTNLKPALTTYPITWLPGVNTLFNGLLNEEWFLNNWPKTLKFGLAGGTALHKAVADRWQQVTGTRVVEGYGLTEASPCLTFNPMEGLIKEECIGIPVPGTDIKLVDDNGNEVKMGEPGELIAKGPQIMVGYLNRPEATAETIKDGWLYTGDVAVVDSDGFFKIVDRKKDMILVSGFNVYPNELEDAIAKHPGVAEVAVIGIPDDKTGEAPKVFIIKKDPSLTEEQVREHCRNNLTGYKQPKFIEFRTELPKTPIGKILRKDLKAEEKAKREKKAAAA